MKDDKRVKQIQKLLDVAEGNLASARHLLLEILGDKKTGKTDYKESAKDLSILNEGKVIEGIFDGEQMIAPDNKKYPVPANYASKSKLVEGDTLKLTIADDGGLIYKQIKPVERQSLVGTLSYDGGSYSVLADGKTYKVLFASVTYYKGEPGNKVSIIIPASGNSEWAAVESIIHDHNKDTEEETKEAPKKKLDLPEENKKILKEVKESFDKKEKEQASPKISERQVPKERVVNKQSIQDTLPKEEPKLSDDMTLKEASEASAEVEETPASTQDALKQSSNQPTSENEHPMIKGQRDYMPEDPPGLTGEEKDTNSLGEETPKIKSSNKITELEI